MKILPYRFYKPLELFAHQTYMKMAMLQGNSFKTHQLQGVVNGMLRSLTKEADPSALRTVPGNEDTVL